MELLLIRHAESEWNARGLWQGHADPPLSSTGRAQAEAHSFSSPMQGTPSKPGATSVVQAIR